jgi:nucleotide-binding universal stress UspA family protein
VRGTIVCDVTDHLAGRTAAEFAAALGARLHLRLVLVSVATATHPGADRRVEELAQALVHAAETRVAAGGHVEALARVADEEGADVIVVGARPAGVGGRNLRWALARELEAATSVPVVVAPPSTRRRSDRRLAFAVETDPR